jgi:predicted acylesterase/phospholipase RssA
MYHMGVVLALIEGGALPSIVSGTSGGAIVAGVLAVHTDDEMRNDIIKPDIAVRHAPALFLALPPVSRWWTHHRPLPPSIAVAFRLGFSR